MTAACGAPQGMSEDEGEASSTGDDLCELPSTSADYSTESIALINHTGGPICRGTLELLDAEAERLAALMGLPLPSPLLLEYGIEAVHEVCDVNESIDEGGCVRGTGCDVRVATSFSPQVHELVHAVRFRNGVAGPSVLEEGLAVYLGDGRPFHAATIGVSHLPRQSIFDLMELSSDELGQDRYAYGAHFMAYLVDEYGLDPVMRALTAPTYPGDLAALFETHLGSSLSAVDERWQSEAWNEAYFTSPPCENTVRLDQPFDLHERLDCDEPQTQGHFGRSLVSTASGTCLVLESPTPVTLSVEGGPGEVNLLGFDCEAVEDDELMMFDGARVQPGAELEVLLAPCTYSLNLSTDWTTDSRTLTFRATPDAS